MPNIATFHQPNVSILLPTSIRIVNKPIKKKWYEETEPEEKKIKGINA